MKKYFLSTVLIILSSIGHSQTLLTQGFEGVFPPSGWTIVNGGTASPKNWSYNTNPAFTDGPYIANRGAGAMVYEYK